MPLPYSLRHFIWRLQTPPLRLVSEILWVLLSGWSLFLYYITTALFFASTIILLPFAWQLIKLAVFSLNPIRYDLHLNNSDAGLLKSPKSPFVIVANVIWLVLFGWELALWHLALALVNAITIIGIGNAVRHLQLAKSSFWVFGRSIVRREDPVEPVRTNNEAPV